ncbi:cation:proton antiporter [Paraburkholderia madseniana]|uniref:Cation:proton antiporter n=1 Tax=Paraburkholderia madseniana TaxID=2599607 RepID=A0AAP5BCZ1_9BURK|nr:MULTISPECIES: cation:proton antiporter [Paraburkholderia]MCX4146339.1 cation:proton antiporter [Paraburkholderia madseniana]MDN7149285.1 cation:proton antiporter [Paraburkholderia sp. WS6]MDQ6408165.1 cation:proton antiporter [Paraburkholderia madseniana]
MSNVELFHYLLLLICGAGALTWLAERVAIPPAFVLLLGGCVIAVAGKRVPEMDPNLMLAAVLPPLLMSSSFYTAWKEFREELGTIVSLVLGAVRVTTAAVAVAVHAFNPGLPWAACFALDALVFILIGLALHGILARVNYDVAVLMAGLRVALPATAAAIAVRLLWVCAAIWLPSRMLAKRTGNPPWSAGEAVVLGWSGMRGVVSLAAALALPGNFPGRDLIVFSTFLLIIATLVVQGGSLAPLIRLLKLRPVARQTMSEHETRARTFGASLAVLEEMGKHASGIERAALERLLAEYRIRVTANENAHALGVERIEDRAHFLRIELKLVSVSREALLGLHRDGKVDDGVLHRIESELDLEELRLLRLLEP